MLDAALEALWKHVVDNWDDDKPHGAFLEHCRQTNQLAEAAARYRGMTGDRVRGAAAQKRLEGVAVLAMTALESTRSASVTQRGSGSSLVVLVLLAALTLGLVGYLYLGR
jgi:hypothetical protein